MSSHPFVDAALFALLPLEWEVQNRVPSGTIVKALIRGGDNGPWMRFMRGETTTEDFLQEFERHCSEMVSGKHACISFLFFAISTGGNINQ